MDKLLSFKSRAFKVQTDQITGVFNVIYFIYKITNCIATWDYSQNLLGHHLWLMIDIYLYLLIFSIILFVLSLFLLLCFQSPLNWEPNREHQFCLRKICGQNIFWRPQGSIKNKNKNIERLIFSLKHRKILKSFNSCTLMHIKENVVNLEQLKDATMWTHFLLDEIL